MVPKKKKDWRNAFWQEYKFSNGVTTIQRLSGGCIIRLESISASPSLWVAKSITTWGFESEMFDRGGSVLCLESAGRMVAPEGGARAGMEDRACILISRTRWAALWPVPGARSGSGTPMRLSPTSRTVQGATVLARSKDGSVRRWRLKRLWPARLDFVEGCIVPETGTGWWGIVSKIELLCHQLSLYRIHYCSSMTIQHPDNSCIPRWLLQWERLRKSRWCWRLLCRLWLSRQGQQARLSKRN